MLKRQLLTPIITKRQLLTPEILAIEGLDGKTLCVGQVLVGHLCLDLVLTK
jgi:hypothetical protein